MFGRFETKIDKTQPYLSFLKTIRENRCNYSPTNSVFYQTGKNVKKMITEMYIHHNTRHASHTKIQETEESVIVQQIHKRTQKITTPLPI